MAPRLLLQHRNRAARAQEHAGQVDIDAAAPVGRRDILDRRRRPGDAGIVDQHINPPNPAFTSSNNRSTAASSDTSATVVPTPGSLAAGRQRRFVHIADMNPGAGFGQRPRDGETDARSAGRYEHPLPIGIEISHVVPPLFSKRVLFCLLIINQISRWKARLLRGYIATEHRKEDGTAMALTNKSLPLRPVPRETVQDHVYRQ